MTGMNHECRTGRSAREHETFHPDCVMSRRSGRGSLDEQSSIAEPRADEAYVSFERDTKGKQDMAKADGMFLYIGTYSSEAAARADYNIVKDLHAADVVGTYDAGVVT